MAKTPSTMLALGTALPEFKLPDSTGCLVSSAEVRDKEAFVVMFICNHCPFVKHLREGLAAFGNDYREKSVAIWAINSNDVTHYPEDSPEQMQKEAKAAGYTFPYLYDEAQAVAKAFHAACTPDFYVFDRQRRLVYRGQFDESRPGNDKPITGRDVRNAVDAVLSGKQVNSDQKPSLGCNIKWKPGQEPDYFLTPSRG